MLGYDDKRNFFRMMVNSPCQLQVTDDESSRTMQAKLVRKLALP